MIVTQKDQIEHKFHRGIPHIVFFNINSKVYKGIYENNFKLFG